jgi:hypothetical protein
VLSAPNATDGTRAVYRGKQTLDPANPFASLPAPVPNFGLIPGVTGTNAPPPGLPSNPVNLSDIERKMNEGLSQMRTGQTVYTFAWELRETN